MFLLASCELAGRSVLLIEDDLETAHTVSASIIGNGGSVASVVPTVAAATAIIPVANIDILMLHVRYAAYSVIPIPELFRPNQVHVEFIACYDEWYDCVEEDDGESLFLANFRA